MQEPAVPTSHALSVVHGSTAGGALWWIIDQLVKHGPSWSLVPPILMGSAACVGAYWSGKRSAQELRHQEDIHILNLEAERRRLGLVKITDAKA